MPKNFDEAMLSTANAPATRKPLREALLKFADMDPVDALRDAETLMSLCKHRVDKALADARKPTRLRTFDVEVTCTDAVVHSVTVRINAATPNGAACAALDHVESAEFSGWGEAPVKSRGWGPATAFKTTEV